MFAVAIVGVVSVYDALRAAEPAGVSIAATNGASGPPPLDGVLLA